MKQGEADGNVTATRADIDQLAEATKVAFDRIEKRLESVATQLSVDGLEKRLDDLAERADSSDRQLQSVRQLVEKSLRIEEAMLSTINSIDGRLQEMSDHTERIIRLEEEVFAPGRNRLNG